MVPRGDAGPGQQVCNLSFDDQARSGVDGSLLPCMAEAKQEFRMPGTVKIWWHDGAVKDVRHHDIPVVNEPEIGFETVFVTEIPAISGPAPDNASVAIVETATDLRYLVRRAGDTAHASAATSKPIRGTVLLTESIGVRAGDTISFIEV